LPIARVRENGGIMSIADRRVEYETLGLDIGDVLADPIEQWWRWYHEATAVDVTEPNGAVLSTIGGDGHPDARFVLVRGVDARGFVFFTNSTSAKGRQLTAHSFAALTFGWLEIHRQVRIRGMVAEVSAAEADEYFTSRPRGAQIGAWASPQSQVIADRPELEMRVADYEARFADDVDVPRPTFWTGYRVVANAMEFWQGRRSRLHDRLAYRLVDDRWIIERLAP
jgi:pyridoxamine 5'-phosphate oxidase